MTRLLAIHAALALLLQSTSATAAPPAGVDLSQRLCGVFEMEGKLTRSARHPGYQELWTDVGAISERRIVLGKLTPEDQSLTDGLWVRAQILLLNACFSDCYGILIQPRGLLDPTEEPRSFAATLQQSRLEPRRCISGPEARKRVLR